MKNTKKITKKKFNKEKKKNNIKDRIINLIKKHQIISVYTCVFIIGMIFSLWLFKPGMIKGHDILYHLSRIKGLKDSILNGDIMAPIHVGLRGYEYANGLFYGNLLFYIPAIFRMLGLGLVNSYKVYVLFCTIASAFTMFWCMKGITKSNKAGLLGSFLYSACSYKACDFIVRAAAGEMGAFIFLPLIVLGFYYIVYDDYKKWYIFTIGFVGLVQCHLISTALIGVIIVLLILINYERLFKEKNRIKSLIISGAVGLLISAYFIFPLLEGFAKNDLNLSQTSSFPSWNFTIPIEKIFLAYPYHSTKAFTPAGIGVLYIVLTGLRLKIKPSKDDKIIKFCDLSIIVAVISLLLITDFFPWKEIDVLRPIQFPWRFYLFASLFITISSTITTYYYLKNKTKKDIIKFIIPVLVIAMIPSTITEYEYRRKANGKRLYKWNDFYVSNGEYLPLETDVNKLYKRGMVVTSNNENIKMEFSKKGNKVIVNYSDNEKEDTYIEIPLLYYYGYVALDEDGKKLSISKGDNNIIRVNNIKNKKGTVKVFYKRTNIQKYSLWLSIISWIVLIVYLLKTRIKFKY